MDAKNARHDAGYAGGYRSKESGQHQNCAEILEGFEHHPRFAGRDPSDGQINDGSQGWTDYGEQQAADRDRPEAANPGQSDTSPLIVTDSASQRSRATARPL
jgi:hypothetical protein